MWELDHKEGWAPKSWCFWTVVPEKTLESPLDCKEIIPVNPKGNQPWIFIGRTDVGKDWEQEEKGATEDEMVGWHHWFNEHESEQILRDSEGQEILTSTLHGVPKTGTWLSGWTTTNFSGGDPSGLSGKSSSASGGEQGRYLVWEDPLEKEIPIHSSILV